MSYLYAIKTAIIIFPIIAFILLIPYILYEYHKYGSIYYLRAGIIYSFILYLLIIFFLVILPLPTFEEALKIKGPHFNFIPFKFIIEFVQDTSLVISNPSTYLKSLTEPCFYVVIFNIIMTIPFGMYLRYFFKCSLKKTVLYTLLLSLFFELTQLSGLYFIYPRGYRLFDVDDLFLNTSGGMIGYGITPIFSHFLPKREKLDALSYMKGKKISIFRRGMAVWIDLFLVSLVTVLFAMIGVDNLFLQYVFSIIIIFIIVPIIRGGYTYGKKWMNIKIVTKDGEKPNWYQYFIRYGVLYLFLLPVPYYFIFLISNIM